jgi:GDP-L-fucose synthase
MREASPTSVPGFYIGAFFVNIRSFTEPVAGIIELMNSPSQSFPYQKVVVTGGAGFLGRFVVERLRDMPEVEVVVPRSSEYNLVEGPDVKRLLDDTKPDLVIHLAAVVGGIGHNQKNPGRFLYENLMMGTQLIEQSRLRGISKFLALGTVCAYPKFTPAPFKEDDIWNGYPEETNAPYGLAKKMMLAQVQAYRDQYGFNGIFLLPANLYGPGDNFDLETSHVIPALIRKCVSARRNKLPFIEAWGSGEVSREFLYVEDCAEGILRAARTYDESAPVNLGNGREVYIKDLTKTIADLTGFTGEIRWQQSRPDGQPRRQLDVSRAFEKFGFRAQTGLEDGLRRTIEWYEQNYTDQERTA